MFILVILKDNESRHWTQSSKSRRTFQRSLPQTFFLGCEQVEVVVDSQLQNKFSQLYAELSMLFSKDPPKSAIPKEYIPLNQFLQFPGIDSENELKFNIPQIRAILLVKLV